MPYIDGPRLRSFRMEAGITPDDFKAKAPASVADLQTSRPEVTDSVAAGLAKALGVSVERLRKADVVFDKPDWP